MGSADSVQAQVVSADMKKKSGWAGARTSKKDHAWEWVVVGRGSEVTIPRPKLPTGSRHSTHCYGELLGCCRWTGTGVGKLWSEGKSDLTFVFVWPVS